MQWSLLHRNQCKENVDRKSVGKSVVLHEVKPCKLPQEIGFSYAGPLFTRYLVFTTNSECHVAKRTRDLIPDIFHICLSNLPSSWYSRHVCLSVCLLGRRTQESRPATLSPPPRRPGGVRQVHGHWVSPGVPDRLITSRSTLAPPPPPPAHTPASLPVISDQRATTIVSRRRLSVLVLVLG